MLSMTTELEITDTGKLHIKVLDRRDKCKAINGGKGKKFWILKNKFWPGSDSQKLYYHRTDTNELVLWDKSTEPPTFSIPDTITPEQWEAEVAEREAKRKTKQPKVRKLTDEEKAEQEQRRAEATAKREQQDRDKLEDAFWLAGVDNEAWGAAIEKLGWPNGCRDRRTGWMLKACKMLDVDQETQRRLVGVLCGRG